MLYAAYISGEYAGDNNQGGEETVYLSINLLIESNHKPTEQEVVNILESDPDSYSEFATLMSQVESDEYFVDEPTIAIGPAKIIKL